MELWQFMRSQAVFFNFIQAQHATECRRPVTHHHPAGSGTRARDVFWQTQLRTPVWLQQAAKQFLFFSNNQNVNFSSPMQSKCPLSEFQKKNSTWIRNCGLMSPAVVASRLDYQNKLVPIDRVLHALKSCRLGRIDRNHHEGGDYGLFWHQKSRRNEKLEKGPGSEQVP